MTNVQNFPAVVINDLTLYMQGLEERDWISRCNTKNSQPLDDQLRLGVAPKLLHDLMVSATVFGTRDRSSKVLSHWMATLPSDAWQRWLDVTNVASGVKRCYGHEAMRDSYDGTPTDKSPLTKLLVDEAYLESKRTRGGPLQSLLQYPSGKHSEDQFLLEMMLQAEKKSPGSCVTPEARQALETSDLKSSAILRTIEIGLDISCWLNPKEPNRPLNLELEGLKRTVDARRIANDAILECEATSKPKRNP